MKPLLDKTVSEQIGSLANRLRNDASLETRRASSGPDVPLDLAGTSFSRRAEPVA